MFEQGDILKLEFNPTRGHEQQGYRPALVVSNHIFNKKTSMAIVCPITNSNNRFPLHVPLDERTATTGVVMCEQPRAVDVGARNAVFLEKIPDDLLGRILSILHAEIEPDG